MSLLHCIDFPAHQGYLRIGSRIIDCGMSMVVGGGAPRRLPPKAYAVLVELVRMQGSFVSKDALLARVWAGSAVQGDVVRQAVFALRRALEPEAAPQSLIQSAQGRGYRLSVECRHALRRQDLEAAPDANAGHGTETPDLAASAAMLMFASLVMMSLAPAGDRPPASRLN